MTHTSFFRNCPDYKVAEPFASNKVGPTLQDNDSTLTEFSANAWEKFNPYQDNRLDYIKEFWGRQGIVMDGSYRSLLDFEQWIWDRAKEWRAANPRPPARKLPFEMWEVATEVLQEPVDDELISLGRDVALYHAYVVSTETGREGQWRKWKGPKSFISRGFPYFEFEGQTRIRRLDLVPQLVGHVVGLTVRFTPRSLCTYNALSRSAASFIEREAGRRMEPKRDPHEP